MSKSIADGERPVLGVSADADGDWSFTDGDAIARDDQIVLLHLFHILMNDPTIEEQITLSPGTTAWRQTVGGPWAYYHHDEEPA